MDVNVSTLRDGERVRAEWPDSCRSVEGPVHIMLGEPTVDLGSYCVNIRDAVVTRLPVAPEPECPFPMGARVIVTRSDADERGQVGVVAGWHRSLGEWYVDVDGVPGGWLPSSLAVAPEHAPITVGSWLEHSDGGVYVVRAVSGGEAHLRRIDRQSANAVGLREIRDGFHWTALDGPPEPTSFGSVVTVRSTGGIDRVAIKDTFGWYVTGWVGVRSWADVLFEADLATLRILESVS